MSDGQDPRHSPYFDRLKPRPRDLVAAARDILGWLRESYDDTAHRFHLETGIVAPGKSVSPRMIGQGDVEARYAAFVEWCRKRRDKMIRNLDAAVEAAEGAAR